MFPHFHGFTVLRDLYFSISLFFGAFSLLNNGRICDLFLVYLQRYAIKTGRICSAKLALTATTSFAQISLPPPPTPRPPPALPQERDTPASQEDRSEQKKHRQDFDEPEAEVIDKVEKKQEEQKKQEAAKPRPMYGFVELTLIYPQVLVKPPRTKYVAEMTSHINSWWRLSGDKKADVSQLWLGLRIAPFGGSGRQYDEQGRFSLTYFGPGIGVGSIVSSSGESPEEPSSRYGWLLSAGIAACTQLGDQHTSEKAEDFQSANLTNDSPGVWAEFRIMRTFMHTLSSNLLLGSQLGEGKTFTYIGVGIGAWL